MDLIGGAFARVRQRRELVAIEILWKWAWALSVGMVAVGSALLFLDSVTLSPAELGGLRSRLPWLVALTLRRLWQRHMAELVQIATIVGLAAVVLWWLAASVFRSGVAGALVEEHPGEPGALGRFGPSVRQSFGAYFASHLWSLAVAAVTVWLSAVTLFQMTGRRAQEEVEAMPTFLAAVLAVAGVLFFWLLIAWVLGLGRAVASRYGWGFLHGLGFALHLVGTRTVDVLFIATTMFLFRAMALAGSAALGVVLVYGAVFLDRRLAVAGLTVALIVISIPARWLFVVQQAAFLELARGQAAQEGSAPLAAE